MCFSYSFQGHWPGRNIFLYFRLDIAASSPYDSLDGMEAHETQF